jgi:hypothetical protein
MSEYNTNYECLYNSFELNINEEITLDELDNIRNTLYQKDILNIFNLDDFDEIKINNAIHEIYEKVKNHETMVSFMLKNASYMLSMHQELGLMILFSYDFLYLTHPCICEYLVTGFINDDKLKKLREKVFK